MGKALFFFYSHGISLHYITLYKRLKKKGHVLKPKKKIVWRNFVVGGWNPRVQALIDDIKEH